MKKLGKELEFISWIRRDGTGTVIIGGEWNSGMDMPKIDDMSYLDEDVFDISCLSASGKTFIASGMNSFVVKLKPEINKVLKFIDALRNSDFFIEHLYLNGSCYQFHRLLKELYPDAEPFINEGKNHIITRIDGLYYDITGIVNHKKYSHLDQDQDDFKKVQEWSFRRNNLLLLTECPFCENPITVKDLE